ncbi:hypothetical protein GJ700_12105 [Duganella sp. FT92W]|uniref:Uncharacterized protein n=1 Tax=Pseudoduganella rivuli TaxID=2666085 RepID=A0A7X2IMA4_9BURK|nr:hypothetical protein [Pseudoduganella rivuli]MRV72454.1 hypothetical protein [Pseudoduganella rivuli]
MTAFFPSAWKRAVDSLVLYQTREDMVYATYFAKTKILGLFWPVMPRPGLAKVAAIDEMLIALMAVSDIGYIPEKLSGALRERYLHAADDIRKQCFQVVALTHTAGSAPQPARS